jgi:hypothetical protein
MKRILYRQFLCLERASDCSLELLALRAGPVPTPGSLIDLTKEHPTFVGTALMIPPSDATSDEPRLGRGLCGAAQTEPRAHGKDR